ncbi:MAG TPA: DUF951 domain-containing protein [Thermomicrobiales bacterium]|nr:DUF951 domain-containing protein [Thermomicrobiales bacterium]
MSGNRGTQRSGPARMRSSGPLEIVIGDVVRLRKPHPCGSHQWTVVRLGADIGLRCHGCNRRVLLPRRELEKRLKAFVSRGPAFEIAEAWLAQQTETGSPEDSGR